MTKAMDPDYPSVVVPAAGGDIDDPTLGLEGKRKPDFVEQDNKGWQ